MATTILGYNRNPSNGSSTQVLGAGTPLVDKNGNELILPAGNVVVSVRLKHLANTPPPADAIGGDTADAVDIRCGSTSLLKATFVALTSNNHVAAEGAGVPTNPALAKTSNGALKIHGLDDGTGDADLSNNGAMFCCVIKYKPMPVL
jgi:hypothetical protein